MGRRGDCIHKRKDNRWEGRYIKEYVCGKAKYSSVYGKSYTETKRKLTEAIQNNTIKKADKKHKEELFSDSLYNWLDNIRETVKPQTFYSYEFLIEKYIVPYVGEYMSKDINAEKINKLLLFLSENGKINSIGGLSESTLSTVKYITTSTIKQLNVEGKIKEQVGKIKIPRKEKKRDTIIFTNDEHKKLEDVLYRKTDLTKLGILICLYTGIRIGELCALKWKDIDVDNRIISIYKTAQRIVNKDMPTEKKTILKLCPPKTKSSFRDIPISCNLLPIIKNFINDVDRESFLITNTQNIPDPRTVENRFKKYLSEANISQKNFHTLRHTFASRCIESGMDVKSLSSILGHSNVSITMNRYVHPSALFKRNQVDRMILYYGQLNGHSLPQITVYNHIPCNS